MLIAISILLAGILILVGVLQYWSYPGKPVPFVDEKGNPLPNSISEKVFINVNGVQQGMIIKGKDVANPVLLYLHGGHARLSSSRRNTPLVLKRISPLSGGNSVARVSPIMTIFQPGR